MPSASPLRRIDRGNLADRAYRQLREALMRGRFAAGQQMPLRSLAAEFGVSMTPVREALLRLASEQALEMDSRGIATVPHLSPGRYAEILELRLELEGRAAARAAGRIRPSEVSELEGIHTRLAAARGRGDAEGVLRENERFHFGYIRAAGQPVLHDLIESLWLRAGPTIRLISEAPWSGDPAGHPHYRLLEALRTGDPEGARKAVEADLNGFGVAILAALQRDFDARAESAHDHPRPRTRARQPGVAVRRGQSTTTETSWRNV